MTVRPVAYTKFILWRMTTRRRMSKPFIILMRVAYLQRNLEGGLKPDDCIFPNLAKSKKKDLSPFLRGTSLPVKTLNDYLQECVAGSGILDVAPTGSKYTRHCFQRGGAQYRYFYDTIRWNLAAVKWWGGWAQGEGIHTIKKYLLDDQVRRESYYGDMKRIGRALECSQGGYSRAEDVAEQYPDAGYGVLLKKVSKTERHTREALAKMEKGMERKNNQLLNGVLHRGKSISSGQAPRSCTCGSLQATPSAATRPNLSYNNSDESEQEDAPAPGPVIVPRQLAIPRRRTPAPASQAQLLQQPIPKISKWSEALRQWEHAAPNLLIPLKDWSEAERGRDADRYYKRKIFPMEVEYLNGMNSTSRLGNSSR
ncbi:hypothetical protein DFS34DRAFT_221236 [Phlyctochytrium arcticum]|nr:hypothetical protein DFS34DRAFT_221236 [Phlyctochytrium arcticum]